jgi:hypothetical protein
MLKSLLKNPKHLSTQIKKNWLIGVYLCSSVAPEFFAAMIEPNTS